MWTWPAFQQVTGFALNQHVFNGLLAGESDEEVDRVMFMQAAVTAYSGFIFDLNANSSLDDFLKACMVSVSVQLRVIIRSFLRH